MRKAGLAVLIFVLCFSTARAATLLPYLVPVRNEITNQLAILLADTNTDNSAQIRTLTQARNLVDRRGRASLQNDLQTLANVSLLLSRTDLALTFSPVLEAAAQNYLATLETTAAVLETNLANLPASDQRVAAEASLDFVNLTLDQAAVAATPIASARTMARAAVRLVALQSLVARLNRDATRRPELRAFAGSETFDANNPTATFSPGTGFLSINGTQTRSGDTRSLSLTISDVRPGTTVHQLSDASTSDYAIYTRRGTNVVGYTSSSGNIIVTLDAAAQTVSGTFSFLGVSRAGVDAPLQVSGGTFFLRYR
jgi:hypothetical protein